MHRAARRPLHPASTQSPRPTTPSCPAVIKQLLTILDVIKQCLTPGSPCRTSPDGEELLNDRGFDEKLLDHREGPRIAGGGRAGRLRGVVGEVPLARLWHAVPSYPTTSELWLKLLEAFNL